VFKKNACCSAAEQLDLKGSVFGLEMAQVPFLFG